MNDKSSRSVRITVSVPAEEHAALEAYARAHDVSLSWVARRAIDEYLARNANEMQLGLNLEGKSR